MKDTFVAGWTDYWRAIGGYYGLAHWVGWGIASITSGILYAAVKAIIVTAWKAAR